MTDHYELTKKYHRGDLITVCLTCSENYRIGLTDSMMHRVDTDLWIPYKPRVKDYPNYSHGMCPEHYQVYLTARASQLHDKGISDENNIFWLRLINFLNGVNH